jgi:hypothetical protein
LLDATDEAGLSALVGARRAAFADYDNDRQLDLFVVGVEGNTLWRNSGDGAFDNASSGSGLTGPAAAGVPLFLDADHDGDLDLYLAARGANRLYRNNLDGTFTDVAADAGLTGAGAASRDAAFGDFDDDDDIDLFVANEDGGNRLYSNARQGRFEDVTVEVGLSTGVSSGAVAVGDYDNDGYLDIFVTAVADGEASLYRNNGDGTFATDTRSRELRQALRGVTGLDAEFFDFDNDGALDLVVAGSAAAANGRGVVLLHNRGNGRFHEASSHLPAEIRSGSQVAVADYDGDGDLDLFLSGLDGGVRLLRNDGGNANQYLRVELVGLGDGSGKNNRFGIGSKLEVRAGDLYQLFVVSRPVMHVGLGAIIKPEAVRVIWTNGVPQDIYYPGSDRDLVEEQVLKGSCAFLYTWDGTAYTFVTDVIWRSALGMPLGIMAKGAMAYAPPGASQEYVRVPGELLKPKDGKYVLQITEELWEIAYFDEVRLLAVDHPESVDVYVDERFVPPAPASLRLYRAAGKRSPLSAVDDRGTDVLDAIRDRDDVYVGNLDPARYQGITKLHDLTLDFGRLPEADSVFLFLNGWVFPTDASINVAVSQSSAIEVILPHLQVKNREGEWQTVIEDLSFPAGKSKTVIAYLTGKFLSDDHRVRIRTNMQVYWDQAFVARGSSAPVRLTTLPLTSADLHERGFSRLFRKGGRYGPHWFDYEEVSQVPRWQPITGRYTRYGDVLPLLTASDDRYVIMAPGDEVTISFDGGPAPELPSGWRRDFLIYTDGWIKDADLNTATGNTVQPLPFHAMSRYPYGADEAYPADEEHQEYLRTYNTREIGR